MEFSGYPLTQKKKRYFPDSKTLKRQVPKKGQKFNFQNIGCYHCTKETADLVTFTEEILNGKLHFL